MPPKRKRTAKESAEAPPQKRQTRSSTKRASSATNASPDVPNPVTETTKPAQPKRAKTKASKSNPKRAASPSETDIPTTLPSNQILYKHENTTSPTLIFTHGAGGTLSAPAVVNFRTGYASRLSILLFQGSMNLKSRVKGFHACIEQLYGGGSVGGVKAGEDNRRILLGGRSMGSRAAVMTSLEYLASRAEDEDAEEVGVDLVLVSYPLVGPKGAMRDQPLLDLPSNANVLFVIGERDKMCPLDVLNVVRKKMKAESWLVVVSGLDHGMRGKRDKELGERTGVLAAEWVEHGGEAIGRERVLRIGEEGEVEEVVGVGEVREGEV